MLRLAIRSWFYDLWDTMFYNLLLNLGFLALLTLPLSLPGVLNPVHPALGVAGLMLSVALLSVYVGLVSRITRDYVDNVQFSIKSWKAKLKEGFLPSLVLGVVNALVVAAVYLAFPYYAAQGDVLSIGILSLAVWFLVFYLLAMQYWLPLNATYEKKIGKLYRKSFMLLWDNPLYSFGVGLWSLLIAGIPFALVGIVIDFSILFGLLMMALGIFPGITGLTLWHHKAFQIRMLKYEYLEKHPDAKRSKLPWAEILMEERARVGRRTLRDLFMPVRNDRGR